MARWPYIAYGALVALGAANRETTAVILLLSWLALRPRDWRWLMLYSAIAGGVYGAIRLSVGEVPTIFTLSSVFAHNTSAEVLPLAIFYNLTLVPLWIMAALGWRHAPPLLKRLTKVVLIVYLPLWAAYAYWDETRLLINVALLALPMIALYAQRFSKSTGMSTSDDPSSSVKSSAEASRLN